MLSILNFIVFCYLGMEIVLFLVLVDFKFGVLYRFSFDVVTNLKRVFFFFYYLGISFRFFLDV